MLWRFLLANVILLALMTVALCLTAEELLHDKHKFPQSRQAAQPFSTARAALPFVLVLDGFTFLTIVIAAMTQFRALSARGGSVAEALGGARVPPDTTDLLERRYLNVVEEMAIAANIPVPEVYILRNEEGINAFASGPSPERSAVAVTRGALERLSRDELQGVVAHEFSHITHGDVRLNIRLASYIYGLMVVYAMGRFLFEVVSDRENRDREKSSIDGVVVILALAFMAFGFLGRLVSVLMSAAISRQREFLADATAVQYTRDPDGIAGALKKIGGYSKGSIIRNSKAESMSHFFLSSSNLSSFFGKLYSTHPPLAERISRIDPSFGGLYPSSSSIPLQHGDEEVGVSMLHGELAVDGGSDPQFSNVALIPDELMPPAALYESFIGLGSAETAVCALLMSRDPHTRARQEEIIARIAPVEEVRRKEALFSQLSLNQRLSIVMMAMPSVQGEARSYRNAFKQVTLEVVGADGEVSLLELLIGTLVHFSIGGRDPAFKLRGSAVKVSPTTAAAYLEVVLSVCAAFASSDPNESARLVEAAAGLLNIPCTYRAAASGSLQFFISSLEWLRNTPPQFRASVMHAFEQIARSDGEVSEHELALLRTFSMLLRTQLRCSLGR